VEDHTRGEGGRYDRGVIDLLNRDAGRTIRLGTVVNAFCFVILLFWLLSNGWVTWILDFRTLGYLCIGFFFLVFILIFSHMTDFFHRKILILYSYGFASHMTVCFPGKDSNGVESLLFLRERLSVTFSPGNFFASHMIDFFPRKDSRSQLHRLVEWNRYFFHGKDLRRVFLRETRNRYFFHRKLFGECFFDTTLCTTLIVRTTNTTKIPNHFPFPKLH
jgi:hypothetical protein